MAFNRVRARIRGGYRRVRNRVHVVYRRTRTRRSRQSFIKKHKTLVILAVLGAVVFFFRDKISALLVKK